MNDKNPDNVMCEDSECPARPIVGGHTRGITVSDKNSKTECSGKEK